MSDALSEYHDIAKLSKQEIDPDDFIDRHPEMKNDRKAWRQIAIIYNRGGQKKFSWHNARHDYYRENNLE